jgi:hypothetical protein
MLSHLDLPDLFQFDHATLCRLLHALEGHMTYVQGYDIGIDECIYYLYTHMDLPDLFQFDHATLCRLLHALEGHMTYVPQIL